LYVLLSSSIIWTRDGRLDDFVLIGEGLDMIYYVASISSSDSDF